MPEQTLLPGFEPEPKLTDRIFFAVLPDADAIAQIKLRTQQLRVQHALQCQPIIDERLHISLLGLGDHVGLPKNLITFVNTAASVVSMSSFTANLNCVLSFSGNRKTTGSTAFVLKSNDADNQLVALQHHLIDALRVALPLPKSANFIPHLTLLYDTRIIKPQSIEPVRWRISEFALVHSRIGSGRPYTILGRWSLMTDEN